MNAFLKLSSVVALAAPFLASAAGLTPEQVARIRHVTEFVVSPDGEHIAYLVSAPRIPGEHEDGPAWSELHVATAGGDTRAYVTGEHGLTMLGWTPDGAMVTFVEKRADDDHAALYGIPLVGGEARRLAALPDKAIVGYALAADGRVAMLARDGDPEAVVKLREQGFSQKVHEEEWRATAVWIAKLGAEAEPQRLAVDGTVHGVRVSPDGRRLALAVAPTPSVDDSLVSTRLRIVDAASARVVARIDNPGKLGDFEWSPDGKHLAYLGAADDADPSAGRLFVAAAGGGEPRDLAPGLEGHVADFAWLDDDSVAFVSLEGIESRVARVGLDGRPRTLIAPGGPVFTRIDASGKTLALNGSTPTHPAELFVATRDGRRVSRVTVSNPWLADVEFAPQERVAWTARDGLALEGVLIRPLGAKRGERHPLIVQVHGGPEAHYANGWLTQYHTPGQVAAARGFAVFYPNYRASTGRGVAFSKLDHEDPAGKEFDDIVDGVDHLIASGLVDGDRVGVTGGSYGGYATAWLSTYHSERFAAGVMAVGISDATMMMALGDIPHEMYRVHLRVWPWENWDLYRERSPLYHTHKSRTPLLIMHGEADTRVHPAHSLALYRLLKLQDNAPVRLVWYPGEGHGNRRAASRYDFSLRQLRWFEHFLQGPGGEAPPPALEYPILAD